MPRPAPHEDCMSGGLIQTVYKRTQGKWIPLGRMCMACLELVGQWEERVTVKEPAVTKEPPTVDSKGPPTVTLPPVTVDSKSPAPSGVTVVHERIVRGLSAQGTQGSKPACTCTQAERVKGKHRRKCPMAGKK